MGGKYNSTTLNSHRSSSSSPSSPNLMYCHHCTLLADWAGIETVVAEKDAQREENLGEEEELIWSVAGAAAYEY